METKFQSYWVQQDSTDWNSLIQDLGISKEAHEISEDDLLDKCLPTVTRWEEFYYAYSRWMGFSVRKDDVRRDENQNEWQRRWVCSKEGFRKEKWINHESRKRTPKPITRTGCGACLRVNLDKSTNMWVVRDFKPLHNHELALPSEIQFLRSNRRVPDSIGAQVMTMKRSGIRTCHILNHITQERGGRGKVPFQKKDLYNWIGAQRRLEEKETDSEGALGYLECLLRHDENFFCVHTVDEEDRLANLFWADHTSQKDYECFGEVLAFDTTYRTNAYNKPLMMLVGVNHHFRTTVFGIALLSDETIDTFKWVLEQFLVCMKNKLPSVVVTDGDHAMRNAIKQILPNAVHRLCAWHLGTNATNNVPNLGFKVGFNQLLYQYFTEEEFEERWKSLITKYDLENSDWARNLYDKKKSWGETYLRPNFFGGLRTTQRCESMNSYLAHFLESKHTLREFVGQIDAALKNMRHTEMQDDFNSKHSSPQIPSKDPLKEYYQQIASILTRKIYDMVAEQISERHAYSITSNELTYNYRLFSLSRFTRGQIRHKVRYYEAEKQLKCTCMHFESDGILCRHIFAVMKHLNLPSIPPSLIKWRWKKDAKTRIDLNSIPHSRVSEDVLQTTRWGSLTSTFNSMGYYASMYSDTYDEARIEMEKLACKFKELCKERGSPSNSLTSTFNSMGYYAGMYSDTYDEARIEMEKLACKFKELCKERGSPSNSGNNQFEAYTATSSIIRDPLVVKTKGRENSKGKAKGKDKIMDDGSRKKKTCRNCNQLGHNRITCKIVAHETQELQSMWNPTTLQSTPGNNINQMSISEHYNNSSTQFTWSGLNSFPFTQTWYAPTPTWFNNEIQGNNNYDNSHIP